MQLDKISVTTNIVVTPQRVHKHTIENDKSNAQNLKDVIPIIIQSKKMLKLMCGLELRCT